ncbi:hypothetical protein ACVWYG_003851 [Pedobacter sp. UYEF25]
MFGIVEITFLKFNTTSRKESNSAKKNTHNQLLKWQRDGILEKIVLEIITSKP